MVAALPRNPFADAVTPNRMDRMPSMKHAAPTPGAASNILVATRAPGRTVIVALAVALALVVMGFLLRGHPVDQQLSQFFNDAHTGALGAITSAVYVAIGPVPAIIITVIMTVVIGIVGSNWRAAVAFSQASSP